MSYLLMLRHGQSYANANDIFAGWLDVQLTDQGRSEARAAGRSLAGLHPAALHTSVLGRAAETARLLVQAAGWNVRPQPHWRLNERHYGALQGLPKGLAGERYGVDNVERWRRGVDARPPRAVAEVLAAQQSDPRYASYPEAAVIAAESLTDLAKRMAPYWRDVLAPELRVGRTVVVVSHGNALRVLDHLSTGKSLKEVTHTRIPTAVPITVQIQDFSPLN